MYRMAKNKTAYCLKRKEIERNRNSSYSNNANTDLRAAPNFISVVTYFPTCQP